LAPEGGHFHILLFEHDAPALVGDDGGASLPLDCVERVYARAREVPLDGQSHACIDVIELFAGDESVAFSGAAGLWADGIARFHQRAIAR
jgi:hypothetical protein